MTPETSDPLGFSPAWVAAGIATPDVVADFCRYAAADPSRSARSWRWAAFRDYLEEHEPLSAETCRAFFHLGEAEPDANLGTAIRCAVLYRSTCPADVRDMARTGPNLHVRRAAVLGTTRRHAKSAHRP